jgi:hypothetical protein
MLEINNEFLITELVHCPIYVYFIQMEVHGVLSHLAAKMCLVEKQNKQILRQLTRYNRKEEEQVEERNVKHKETKDKEKALQKKIGGASTTREIDSGVTQKKLVVSLFI